MIRHVLLALAVVALALSMMALIVWAHTFIPQPQVRRIDCTWSEISPDFSPAMRKACRKARTQ